jgi:Flp pilus assembly protein TadB
VTSAEMDELVRRANASGFDSIADYAASLERTRRRAAVAGWIAGCVLMTGSAWWWSNVYIALSFILGGMILSVVVWKAA